MKNKCFKKVDTLKKLDIGITHKGKGIVIGKEYDGIHHYWYVKKNGNEEIFMTQKAALSYANKQRC